MIINRLVDFYYTFRYIDKWYIEDPSKRNQFLRINSCIGIRATCQHFRRESSQGLKLTALCCATCGRSRLNIARRR